MKMTRNQLVGGLRIAGLYLMGTVPAVLTYAGLALKQGTMAIPDAGYAIAGMALGVGLLAVGTFASIRNGQPACPVLARLRQKNKDCTR